MKKVLKVLGRIGIFIITTLLMAVILLYSVMWICVNGPSDRAKTLFVMSVRETSAVGFLADIYLSKAEIDKIVADNTVEDSNVTTDISLIKIPQNTEVTDNASVITEENELPENLYASGEGIEIYDVRGATYKGKMAVIRDPSRVFVGTCEKFGKEEKGANISVMAQKYGACLGTNAGGFIDEKGFGLGGEPLGLVISEGKLKYGEENQSYQLCGFNKDNIMVVGTMTGKQALESGIRDAVSFGPVLVVNGEAVAIKGTGGGVNPRTAIGQRNDGAVLLLVVDGRQTSSVGATYLDLSSIMLEYGAVNAFNLDGGSSSAMYYQGKIINSVSTGGSLRDLPTTILVR